MSATQNGPYIRYLRPIDYLWAFGALYIAINVIRAKPEVHDNLLIASILNFPTTVCWSRNAFGAFGNLGSALDVCGYLLGIASTNGSIQDPSNVPL
jgi:hypothetical protein